MRYVLLAIGGLVVLAYWHRRRERGLSRAWFVENERREWGSGVDQVSIRWPIRKPINEAARWNTQRLRKQA